MIHGTMTHVTAALPAQRQAALTELAPSLRGSIALPGSDDYSRLTAAFNSTVDVRPLVVAAALDAYDVAAAVRTAGRHGLRVGVQATGHGASAATDGALLVHTGAMDECVVHPEGWARVGAGVRWRTVLDAAAPLGLAPLAGTASGVGVVGSTTGGAIGPLLRTYGAASDRVRALDVVTGNGRLVRATPTEHEDLFWGLRGGKGSLGIVTALEFDLVRLERVYGGALHFGTSDVPAVLRTWRLWSAGLPETATTSLAVRQLPPLPHVPPPLAGRMTVSVRFASTGSAEEGERLLAPLRAAATPVLDGIRVLPYAELDAIHGDPVSPMPVHQSAGLLRELTAGTVETLLDLVGPGSQSPLAVVELRRLGGAFARPSSYDSAVCHREADCLVHTIGLQVPPVAEAVVDRAQRLHAALAPWSSGATLPNFGGGAAAYDAPTLDRLRATVARHDPDRVLVAADAVCD